MTKQELIALLEQEQDNTNEHRTWYAFQQVLDYLSQEGN